MTPDFFFIGGIIVAALSIPCCLAAVVNKHSPVLAVGTVVLGALFISAALLLNPDGYTMGDIPTAAARVANMILG